MSRKKVAPLMQRMADELRVLHAAWTLAEDDNRRTKALYVGPATARQWYALWREASRRSPEGTERAP